jgi:hypothetical protein
MVLDDRRRRFVEPLALAALVFLVYAPFLSRPFTSEDFLLIRFLQENPPWSEGLAAWTGPWLGITVVQFYRPVSTFLYALEAAAFGAEPWGYNFVHTLVHAGNAVLVWALVRRLSWRFGVRQLGFVPVVAAVLFALYPLHPNAVLFSASFATLFGASFLLAAFLAWQRFREDGRRLWWGLSLAGFAAALLSYEAAAVFPALVLAYELLTPDPERRPAARALPALPFFGLLGLYFLLRRAVFGVFVGGYQEYSDQLQSLGAQWRQGMADVATSIVKLHLPQYGSWPEAQSALAVSLLLLGVPVAVLLAVRRRLGSGPLRSWLLAWAWVGIAQAPFAFRPAVPGNGRYWYLAAIGVALALAVLGQALAELLPRRARIIPGAALMALSLLWGGLLNEMLGIYQGAGNTARRIQGELIRTGTAPGAPRRIFLTRYPYFLENPVPVPYAQIFHYGLRDAVHPPFSRESVNVFPLPPLAGAELLPVVLAGPENGVYEWDAPSGTVRPAPVPEGGGGLREIAATGPAPGALEIELGAPGTDRLRLVVVTPGNAMVTDFPPGTVRTSLPAEFVRSMARLYPGGEGFWWVEARDAAGALTGFSRMRGFRLPR